MSCNKFDSERKNEIEKYIYEVKFQWRVQLQTFSGDAGVNPANLKINFVGYRNGF